MKKISFAILAVGLAMASHADSSLRATIDSTNKKIEACMMKKDIEGFVKIVKPWITKDFKYSEGGQTMTFDQMVKNMRDGMGQLHKVTAASTKVVSLKEMGDKAVVVMRHHSAGIMMGPDKKKHTMVFDGTSTSDMRKEGGKWRMATMSWGKQTMTMDGKPFNPQAMGGETK